MMKKLLLNFIASVLCFFLAVAMTLAAEYTDATDNLTVEWLGGDGTDIYNLTGDNVVAIRSERGHAIVNITGTGSRVVDNCSDDGCPTKYFNGQFSDTFSGADGTTLAQHYPPWYGVRYPSTASNCVIASGVVACTPVLGDELVVNETFDADENWTKGTGWSIGGGVATSDNSQTDVSYLTNTGAASPVTGKYYYTGITVAATGGFQGASYYFGGTAPGLSARSGRWAKVLKPINGALFNIYSLPDFAGTVDDASAKEVIWSTFLSNVTDYKFKTEVKYSADITAADGDIAMIAFKVGDLTAGSEDFCRVELNKGTDKVELKKVVAGVETTPLSAAVTIVPGATLLVRTDATDTDGTKWEVYYNGSQVGGDQTITEASLDSAVAGFMATSAGTTFDNWKAGKNI